MFDLIFRLLCYLYVLLATLGVLFLYLGIWYHLFALPIDWKVCLGLFVFSHFSCLGIFRLAEWCNRRSEDGDSC